MTALYANSAQNSFELNRPKTETHYRLLAQQANSGSGLGLFVTYNNSGYNYSETCDDTCSTHRLQSVIYFPASSKPAV